MNKHKYYIFLFFLTLSILSNQLTAMMVLKKGGKVIGQEVMETAAQIVDKGIIQSYFLSFSPKKNPITKAVPSIIKKTALTLLSPLTIIVTPPENLLFSLMYKVTKNIAGNIIVKGKELPKIGFLCNHIATMLDPVMINDQDLQQKVLYFSLARFFFLAAKVQRPVEKQDKTVNEKTQQISLHLLKLQNEMELNFEVIKKDIKNPKGFFKQLWLQLGIPFGSVIGSFLLGYSRFYPPLIYVLKTYLGFRELYRYINWVHQRPRVMYSYLKDVYNGKESSNTEIVVTEPIIS